MKLLYKLLTPYRCKICGEDMLFFQTARNTLIDYKPFLDNALSIYDLRDFLESKHVKYLRCLHCNKSFIIDWSEGWPQQLIDPSKLKDFGIGLSHSH